MHDRIHLPPELVRELSLYLDERDLRTAVLVNKDWRDTWTPYLWTNFTVIGWERSKAVIDRKYQRTLARNAHHIRNVYLWCDAHVKVLQALCKVPNISLTSLCVRASLCLDTDVNRLVNIIQQSPQLRVLEILPTPSDEKRFERLLVAIASSLPRLQSLKLDCSHGWPQIGCHAARMFLETCSSELETLDFKFWILYPKGSESIPSPTTIPGSMTHLKLKVLKLEIGYPYYYRNNRKGQELIPWVVQTFLKGCPGLEIADDNIRVQEWIRTWRGAGSSTMETLHRVMGIKFRLCFDRSPGYLEETTPIPLSAISGLVLNGDGAQEQEVWQAINLGRSPQNLTDVERQLIVHAATQRGFQRLTLNDPAWLTSEGLLNILELCPTLRAMNCHQIHPILTAAEVTRRPWSCRWLKSLHLIISGVPRPDVTMDAMGRPIPVGTPLHSGTMEESRVIQRQVYSKLGSLVCLEELSLGSKRDKDAITERDEANDETWMYSPHHQLTCLEMTLESGLDLLSELKSLRTLDVWNMEHKIGKNELLWMERQWRCFKHLQGMAPPKYLRPRRTFGSPQELLKFKTIFLTREFN
ncbi:hypothetical protein BGX23_006870 [Mortierella sp. AD031]|nr:hypothetical protein BGX23_006870 [Mortierella sp. AD031]